MPWLVMLKKLKLNSSRTNLQKRCSFHCRGLECKGRKTRNTWGNRHVWPWSTEWSRAKTNKSSATRTHWSQQTPSSDNTRDKSTQTSPDGQHRNEIDYTLCSPKWRISIQSAKTRPGADRGSDHGLRIAKFRLKLKKVGKTARLFRYDLNQIPYDYIVEVTDSKD